MSEQQMIGEVPKEVIMCCMGVIGKPESSAGLDWCHKYGRCFTCAKEASDALFDELARLKTDRDRALAELDRVTGEDVATLEERGLIKLPVDADDKPWYIGDLTESGQTIHTMGLNMHGWYFIGTVNEIDPAIHRHYREPTVEDVLREFAEKMNENIDMYTGEAIDADEWRDADRMIIAEYAKKLRLNEADNY